jgi:DNA-binding MarR family transcriptional regulator
MPEEIPGATTDDFARMYTYTHLLKNLRTEREERDRKEKADAPKIAGWRAAAVLARLWVDADLKLVPASQFDMAVDLGMNSTDMTDHLDGLRDVASGEPLVEEVKGTNRREKLHRITEAGRRELQRWVLAHYSTEAILKHVTQISPDKRKIDKLIDLQRNDLRNALGIAGPPAAVASDDR